jgi:hypothetical protein
LKSTLPLGLPFYGTLLLFFLTACGDDNAMVTVYDKAILDTPISCMKLHIFPKNKMIEETIQHLYRFDPSCPLKLDISYKNGITCNSTFNVQTKSINGFPSSYLNMELREGFSLKYSYYIDLKGEVKPKDLEKGFDRIRKDLRLERK